MVTGDSRCQWDDRTTYLVCGAPGPDRTGQRDKQLEGKKGWKSKDKGKTLKKKLLKT